MFSTIFADTITIKIGNTVLYLGTNLIVYVAVAAIVGLVAEFLVGWRLPFGIIGATIAALIGIWIMTQVIVISGIPDYAINTTPPIYLVRAIIGAALFVFIWHLLTFPLYRRRNRRNYRRYENPYNRY
ncbi:MAG TPA: hypothetical protein VNW73_06265 [Ktedonobacteraceae bacterium]|jgi:uncharacterized membrane protein YeaQ/YmgE (transglycosylase-associated protein family)|nr:hypothetical protein [Ktedonobacteraceae bacterium]